jgi:hypothetical protein
MSTKDGKAIKIAGGGISGLAAAISLKSRGFEVEVFEKRKQVGGRFKGDLQGLENWTRKTDILEEIRDMGLGLDLSPPPLPPLYFMVNADQIYPVQFEQPLCYLVKRGTDPDSLDQAIYRRAQALDIPVRLGKALAPSEADIVATGPNSKKIFVVDVGIKFRTRHEDIAVALVDDKAAFRGYAYLLITRGYGCLCTVLFDRFHELRNQFELAQKIILERFPVQMDEVREVGGVGSFGMQDHFRASRMHVGEAAGLQDLLFGFGISSAMRSGVLAAECWETGKDYAAEAEMAFSGWQRASMVNRFLYEKMIKFKKGFKWFGPWLNEERNRAHFMHRAYQFSSKHRLLFPLAKKKMGKRYPGLI